jgi:hypothetical protein
MLLFQDTVKCARDQVCQQNVGMSWTEQENTNKAALLTIRIVESSWNVMAQGEAPGRGGGRSEGETGE